MKKLTSLLLVGLLAVSMVFAGCGGKKSGAIKVGVVNNPLQNPVTVKQT